MGGRPPAWTVLRCLALAVLALALFRVSLALGLYAALLATPVLLAQAWRAGGAGPPPRARPRPDAIFWVLAAVVLAGAAALRAFWTGTLAMPYLTPDSASYLRPALQHPALPLSPMRTAGYPYLIALGLWAAGHPRGILLAHHGLWAVSSLALATALYARFRFRAAALALLAYLAIAPKNLAIEYFVMSEHTSRSLYVLTAAVALVGLGRLHQARFGLVLGALVLANVLAKPSALVLLPAAALLYAASGLLLEPARRRRVATGFATLLLVVGGGLGAYGLAYQARYGHLGLSDFTGWNLFCHVGHLVDLRDPTYPEIAAELRPFMPLYIAKYAGRGSYECNWLVYGSTNADLRSDFGEVSPARVVRRHAGRLGPSSDAIPLMNRIYLTLALNGIRAHPRAYLGYAWEQGRRLATTGLTFAYGDNLRASSLGRRQAAVESLTRILGDVQGDPAAEARARRLQARVERAAWSPAVLTLVTRRWFPVETLYADLWRPLEQALGLLAVAVAVAVPVLVLRGPPARPGETAGLALFLTGIVGGYVTSLAFFNTSEPPRFLANVQDLLLLQALVVVASSADVLRRCAGRWVEARGGRGGFGLVRHRAWRGAVASLGVLVVLLLVPLPPRRVELTAIAGDGGLAYRVDLQAAGVTAPSDREGMSGLLLEEGGEPLPFPHQLHVDIGTLGEGRYSHWGSTLYFSTSDNTDPRTNGRRYTLRVPRALLTRVWPGADLGGLARWGGLAVGLALVGFSLRRPARRGPG